jgi:Uma2 family endonuclease
MIDLIESLQAHFRPRPDVYVSGNILMFYEEGCPHVHLSPDVLVTLDVPQQPPRESYKVWVEGKAPDLIIEVTSKSTRMRDVGVKKGVYEALGVREYLLFDPCNEYLKPRFQVFRLDGELFKRVLVGEETGYASERTGLEFRVIDGALRVFHLARCLPTPRELTDRLQRLEAENLELRRRLGEV